MKKKKHSLSLQRIFQQWICSTIAALILFHVFFLITSTSFRDDFFLSLPYRSIFVTLSLYYLHWNWTRRGRKKRKRKERDDSIYLFEDGRTDRPRYFHDRWQNATCHLSRVAGSNSTPFPRTTRHHGAIWFSRGKHRRWYFRTRDCRARLERIRRGDIYKNRPVRINKYISII